MKKIFTLTFLFFLLQNLSVRALDKVDYLSQVKPLLAKNCTACHGLEKQKGGLRLDTGSNIIKGGNTGKILVPGKSADSKVFHSISGKDSDSRMPPEPKPLLMTQEVSVISRWIDEGALIPQKEEELTSISRVNKNLHWSFQAIKKNEPPRDSFSGWVRTPIDSFIAKQLVQEGLKPSKEAAPLTLLRRVYLDLTGLPPSISEVDKFLGDLLPGAYERAVDRALSSPRYGEKWSRYWLDLARYADSDGYEKDTGRPYAWRYRQWVIDALNADMAFDSFTVDQIAGDLVKGAKAEQKVATGFHRNTLTNKEGGADQEQFRVEAVIDRVNTTAKVFLGLTLGCAQCHDHKYDSLSQREYYQFFAFFNSDVEVNIEAPALNGELEQMAKKNQEHKNRLELFQKLLAERKKILEADSSKWEGNAKQVDLPEKIKALLKIEVLKRTKIQQDEILKFRLSNDEKAKGIQKQLVEVEKSVPLPTMAQTLALGKERKTNILIRGDFLRKGVEVEPTTPAALPEIVSKAGSNRLDLANWVVGNENPLTRRVIVNWVWHKFFGRGIVPTLEDFGTQGEKPSHPELLDYLALNFSENGWSLKHLHRSIVTSAVYRQSSFVEPEQIKKDPYNVFLSRQVRLRLDAEGVRDTFLFVSGLLDQRIGGASVKPPQPPGISELTYANAVKWNESKGIDRYRRGLYIWFQRTSPYPSLMLFDAPDSNLACVRRERSNTPLQALALMNDVAFYECAKNLGESLASSGQPFEIIILQAFRNCLSRFPSGAEKLQLQKLFFEFKSHYELMPEQAKKLFENDKNFKGDAVLFASYVALIRVMMNLDELIVRD